MDEGVILSMKNVIKYFDGTQALKNGCLDIKKGEIHALVGENGAGKSTLMNILCGVLQADGGTVNYMGGDVSFPNVRRANESGIVMIYQELNSIKDLTVAQNMFIGREIKKGPFINDAKMAEESEKFLKSLGSDINPTSRVSELSVAEQQMVEIAKALTNDIKILILDEPTTALGNNDAELLFKVMLDLKKRGISMIYISHRMEEIFRISDRITVMRDGEYIKTVDTAETNKDEIVRMLVGHELKNNVKQKSNVSPDARVRLEVKNICVPDRVRNVSFSLKEGEILGISGLMGAGRSELVRGICGIDEISGGEIFINGKRVKIKSPKQAKELGICYLSENRNEFGLMLEKPIVDNTVMSSIEKYRKFGILSDSDMIDDAEKYNSIVKTKMPSVFDEAKNLSGGNRQKVIIARWLISDLDVMIFDEPTKGIDVGAKDEIYSIINSLAQSGKSVIIISSEISELQTVCDRILVMSEGALTADLDISGVTREKIMQCALGGK